MHDFSKITLLITHYNRSKSLENLLKSFRDLKCSFGGIVVSDDGSDSEHVDYLSYLESFYPIKIVGSSVNRGLGNNLNKGQDEVITPFTLYVQEDFQPLPLFPDKLKKSLDFMEADSELDIVRFWSYSPYPYLKPFSDGFSQMYIKPLASNYSKIYYYGDTPHLRRSSFFEKFGRYREGLSGDRTEYKMCVSFIQNKGKGLFYQECDRLFTHLNRADEPSTMIRSNWRHGNNFILKIIRDMYRQIKYNYDIMMPEHR